jgi:hypothetical protein
MTKIGFAVALLFFAVTASAQAPKSYGGFPDVPTTAKAGEFILVPSYNWIEDAAGAKGDKTSFIFYSQTMVTPGPATSKIKYMRDEREVPNSYIIAIPKGGKAKAGDIVLTWWQSGSGMQRAIVMSAADATRPVVRYLDLGYDNPAKSRDGTTTIGKMDEQLQQDSFVLLKEAAPGSAFRCGAGNNAERWKLVAAAPAGDQLMLGGSRLKRFTKGECNPMPVKPAVKAGQMVSAGDPYTRHLQQVKIERVDAKIGRAFFLRSDKKEDSASFGDIAP